ncbi:MAG: hypothetical protein P4L76_08460, partial [Beijerinckiaceae bacterium]|nr:hypothetical protein [Beijerinckiaceae bacterium]
MTGARDLSSADQTAMRLRVESLLTDLQRMVETVAREPAARAVYSNASPGASAEFRIVSPLAEGADRLVAEEALKLGYKLSAPFPFARADYENDFPDSKDAFNALAAQAEIFELDGARGALETASYEAVGRFVVRNCDFLVAIWDGKPARGRGGTAEIVQFAALSGVPVWWLNLSGDEPRLIYGLSQFRRRERSPRGPESLELIQAYIERLVVPPPVLPPEYRGVISHAVRFLKRAQGREQSPLETFLSEPVALASGGLWRSYALFVRLVMRSTNPASDPIEAIAPAPKLPSERWWKPYFDRADHLSVAYGERYRSSYVLIISLAFATVVTSLLGHAVLPPLVALMIEIVLILSAITLIWANHDYRWHERWIFYRLLAELCRKQMMLSPVG